MSQSLMEGHGDRIAGVLSCYDRAVVTGLWCNLAALLPFRP